MFSLCVILWLPSKKNGCTPSPNPRSLTGHNVPAELARYPSPL
jgi:hypothetical protein